MLRHPDIYRELQFTTLFFFFLLSGDVATLRRDVGPEWSLTVACTG